MNRPYLIMIGDRLATRTLTYRKAMQTKAELETKGYNNISIVLNRKYEMLDSYCEKAR